MPTASAMPLPHDKSAPALARRHVLAATAGWAEEAQRIAVLLTSEVVTNAVRHGAAPVSLAVDEVDGVLRVEVADASTDVPRPSASQPAPHSEGGRGLPLLAQLSWDWGYRLELAGGGKAVWFEVAADCEAARRRGVPASVSAPPGSSAS